MSAAKRRAPSAARGAGIDVQQAWSTRGSRVERIDRVLVDELAPRVEVRGPEAHHLRDVLRVRPGDGVEAFDGRGAVARGEVVAVDREAVTLELGAVEAGTAESPLDVTLAVALLKGDKLSDVVRPATELGVRRFALFVSTNCEARELSGVRLTRLHRVAQEAARQSGRAVVPSLAEPTPLAALHLSGEVLVGDPAAETSFGEYLAGRLAHGWKHGAVTADGAGDRDPNRVTIVTGPEGGLSEVEMAQLLERGARGLRLGPRILRADTAPVAMAAALLLATGR